MEYVKFNKGAASWLQCIIVFCGFLRLHIFCLIFYDSSHYCLEWIATTNWRRSQFSYNLNISCHVMNSKHFNSVVSSVNPIFSSTDPYFNKAKRLAFYITFLIHQFFSQMLQHKNYCKVYFQEWIPMTWSTSIIESLPKPKPKKKMISITIYLHTT